MVNYVQLPVDGTGQKVRTVDVIIGTDTVVEQVIRTSDLPLASRIDEVSTSLMYQGWAECGTTDDEAKWTIRKVEKVNTVTSITWADGNSNRDNIWDNRAGLNYI
jgi:hypothetical protein